MSISARSRVIGPIPDERIDEMARDLEIGRWTMRFALYGDEAVAGKQGICPRSMR